MKKSALIVSLAGLACTGAAFAQEEAVFDVRSKALDASNTGGFAGRPVVAVWGTNASDFRGYNTPVFPNRGANDFNFAGGPAGSVVGNVNVVGAYFGIGNTFGATSNTCDIRVTVFRTFGGWVDGTFPGSNQTGQAIYPAFVVPPPGTAGGLNISYFAPTTNIAMALGSVPNTAGTDGMFMVEALLPGTTTLHPTMGPPATIGTALVVGQSDAQRWGDSTGPGGVGGPDGLCQPLNGTAVWEVNSAAVAGGRAIYGGLWADVPVPPPPSEAIPCLTDGTTTLTLTIAAGQVKWYGVCLNGAADDDVLKYLDIDSEGSVDNVAMCLYDASGAIVGYAGTDEGSGTNAQLSFGVGRRAEVGDGNQYDGRMGDLLNTGPGQYYLAVGGEGTTFGSSFTASASAVTTATNTTVNLRTNTNGGANGPSVVPIINGVDYNDPISFDLAAGTTSGTAQLHDSLSPDSVRWSTFTLTNGVCSSGGYVDIAVAGVGTFNPDLVAWVFNSSGDIVAFSDDTGGTANPQFSFGATTPARPAIAPSTQDFSGQDGNLDAGTYYLATALYDANDSDLSFLPSGHRWHVRGASLSSLEGIANIDHAPGTGPTCGPTGPVCDSIDFNNDTSFFDPQDIDAFLSVYSEGPCIPESATCNDIDFNNDTSVFDPCDISSFLQVYAEGPCELCPV
ncbi:MAG: hypothetical protein U0640_00445 [Phycisphaerales bacterium]